MRKGVWTRSWVLSSSPKKAWELLPISSELRSGWASTLGTWMRWTFHHDNNASHPSRRCQSQQSLWSIMVTTKMVTCLITIDENLEWLLLRHYCRCMWNLEYLRRLLRYVVFLKALKKSWQGSHYFRKYPAKFPPEIWCACGKKTSPDQTEETAA